jgi:hypothetical protein
MKKRGLGLFSWQTDSQDNALTYAGGVIVGGVLAFLAVAVFVDQIASTNSRIGRDWSTIIGAAALLIVGAFLAHAGVIYWWQKLVANHQQRRGR